MSSHPIISGIRKFPNAAISMGMATQKIMMLPCMVTSALYFPGVTIPKPGTCWFGNPSCMRKTYARKPPITRHGHARKQILHGDHFVVGGPEIFLKNSRLGVMNLRAHRRTSAMVGIGTARSRAGVLASCYRRRIRIEHQPGGVVLLGFDDHAPGHQAVAYSAHLRALNVVGSDAVRAEPAGDRAAGQRVLLEAKCRHGKAVHHVAGHQFKMIGRIHRHVQFPDRADIVGCVQDSVGTGLLKTPGPLLGEHAHRLVGGRHGLLDVVPDHDRRNDDDDVAQDDQNVGNRNPPREDVFLLR